MRNPADPTRKIDVLRAWVAKNPEKVKKARAASVKRWKARHPEKAAALNRKWWLSQYGLTQETYDLMLESQERKCLMCGSELLLDGSSHGSLSPVVDHCHSTGRVRGILHNKCNKALGTFEQVKEIAMKYLG